MARKLMGENPESRQKEDSNKGPASDIASAVKQTTTVPTSPEARVVEGFDTVQPVNRTRPVGSVEAARQRNNRTRDMRTNLGRGLPSTPTIE